MVPFRKLPPVEDAPPSSGPPTLRSARFEAAAARPGFAPYDSEPLSDDDDELMIERSDIIPAVKRRELIPLTDEELELQDEDLEILFDDEPILDLGEPDTERTVAVDDFDTEPPPPTLRCVVS